ncbi:MAG: sulfurtransferase [Cyanobacteriota bacterium]|jgi:thiosulfate/3-mercaptopyruvate sulfurtransferase|nr:sulfurtransferase [Cyanobacteriota bacterium]
MLLHLNRSSRLRLLSPAVAAVVGGVLQLAALGQAARAGAVTFISPSEAASAAQSGQWKVLDVRPVPGLEYVSGHVPGAVHISEQSFRGPNGRLPYQIWPEAKLAELLGQAGVSNRDKVLVYSDGTNVLGASLVAYILEKSGLPKVAIVDGGFSGYKAAGQPLTKAFPTYSPASFRPTTTPNLAIKLPELLPLIGRPDVVIVDPRPKALFEGSEQTFIRNGHIPGALNITWQSVTEANNPDDALKNPHKLKPLAELRNLFVSRGVTPDKLVVVSCSTGREASLQYLVLKHLLGYPKVRIYEGSWTEYSATNHPVQTGPETPRAAAATSSVSRLN